ncbi:MAG: hypothetical protein Q9188_002446 [Gyalolechia gomerana]
MSESNSDITESFSSPSGSRPQSRSSTSHVLDHPAFASREKANAFANSSNERQSIVRFIAAEHDHYGDKRPRFVLNQKTKRGSKAYNVVGVDDNGNRTEEKIHVERRDWIWNREWVYLTATVNGKESVLYRKSGGDRRAVALHPDGSNRDASTASHSNVKSSSGSGTNVTPNTEETAFAALTSQESLLQIKLNALDKLSKKRQLEVHELEHQIKTCDLLLEIREKNSGQ